MYYFVMGIFSDWFNSPWGAGVEAYNKAVYVLVKDLKESDAIAKTFLSSMPVESYLDSIGKIVENYSFVDVSAHLGDNPLGYNVLSDFSIVENKIDLAGVVGSKLFDGKKMPDTIRIHTEKVLVETAKELGAVGVAGVQYDYTDGGYWLLYSHTVYLNGVALIPKN